MIKIQKYISNLIYKFKFNFNFILNMKPYARQLINSLINNSTNKIDYSELKLEDVERIPNDLNDNLIFAIIKNIFFFSNNNCLFKTIKEQKQKYDWLEKLFEDFDTICTYQENKYYLYISLNRLFGLYYDNIIKDFNDFIKSLEGIKFKIDYDLFSSLVSFLSYLNGNNNYLNVFSELNGVESIYELKDIVKENMAQGLWYHLT